MGRTNKNLQGAFTLIAGNEWEKSAMDQFISRHAADDQQFSLVTFLNLYRTECDRIERPVQELAQLETIIMQIKARNEMKDVIVYFNKNKYIYARMPFYRSDKNVKEVRVIIDPIKKYFKDGPTAENLIKLNNNQDFMELVYDKLRNAMDAEIEVSIRNYDILKNNLEYSK